MGESPFSREVKTPRGLRDPRGTGPVPLGIKQGVCQLPEQAAGTKPCSRSHQRHAASPRGSSSAAVGVGAPRLPLPRQRPGTATVLTSAVSRAVPVAAAAVTVRVLPVPCTAVCGRPTLLGAVPTQTQTVPRQIPGAPVHKATVAGQTLTVPCTAAAVPAHSSPSPRTCPCPRAHCGFRRWSPSPWPCPNPPSANTAPGHLPVTRVHCPAPLTAQPRGATTALCPWGSATGCCAGCSCPRRFFPCADHSKVGFGMRGIVSTHCMA